MAETTQVNVRVAAGDRPLIVALAERLRSDPGFRERFIGFLEDDRDSALAERVKKLEQQVSWLLSGAIVVPRAVTRLAGVTARPVPGSAPR